MTADELDGWEWRFDTTVDARGLNDLAAGMLQRLGALLVEVARLTAERDAARANYLATRAELERAAKDRDHFFDLYERGYGAIGACDISNYLALCADYPAVAAERGAVRDALLAAADRQELFAGPAYTQHDEADRKMFLHASAMLREQVARLFREGGGK